MEGKEHYYTLHMKIMNRTRLWFVDGIRLMPCGIWKPHGIRKYDTVAMLRSDVFYATPIDIHSHNHTSQTVVLPGFAMYPVLPTDTDEFLVYNYLGEHEEHDFYLSKRTVRRLRQNRLEVRKKLPPLDQVSIADFLATQRVKTCIKLPGLQIFFS